MLCFSVQAYGTYIVRFADLTVTFLKIEVLWNDVLTGNWTLTFVRMVLVSNHRAEDEPSNA
jgi:hypothetical protein